MRCMLRPTLGTTVPVMLIAITLVALSLLVSIASAQTYSVLLDLKSGPGGSFPYATPILDSKGNLYGTTCNDGAFAGGTVIKVDSSGRETVLHSFSSVNGDGDGPYAPVLRDAQGDLYGTTQYGGIYGGSCTGFGCGIVFKIDTTGKETVLHKFSGIDGMVPEQGLISDQDGNLYGTTSFGGAYSAGSVFKITPSGALATLYSFGYGSSDGYYPYGGSLVRDSSGHLYGTTQYGGTLLGGTLFKIDKDGSETVLHEFGATGDGSGPGGTLVIDAKGNLYGTTQSGGAFTYGTVFQIDSVGNETILHSFTGKVGEGSQPSLGLTRDSAGNLYGATTGGGSHFLGTIFKLDTSNHLTTLHSFNGYDGRSPDYGMVADSNGNLYGTSFMGGRYGAGVVFKITP